jgi:hypothetical protein
MLTTTVRYGGAGSWLPQEGEADFHRRRSAIANFTRHLFPKGADTYELHTHPGRLNKVKYRAPCSRSWREIDLDVAMVADRVWETHDRTFRETHDGESLMQTTGMAHLRGRTLNIEEN